MLIDADPIPHDFIFIDEVGFTLTKERRRGRNIIGHRDMLTIQRGGNITVFAAISQNGVLLHHANLGPYNTKHIVTFLDRIHNISTAKEQMDAEQMRCIVIRDNVSVLRSALVQNCFMSIRDFQSNTSHNTLPYLKG